MKISFTCFLILFFNVATRKFTVTCVAHIIFLLDIAGLENKRFCPGLVEKDTKLEHCYGESAVLR
jgi:hypothetical protein